MNDIDTIPDKLRRMTPEKAAEWYRAHAAAANAIRRTLIEDGHPDPKTGLNPVPIDVAEWIASDDTGLSSRALCNALTNYPRKVTRAYPRDPEDFGRCHRMLATLGLRHRINEAAAISPVWARMVARWPEMEALWLEESPSGWAPKLFALMQKISGGG
jgi:hypothetical protein